MSRPEDEVRQRAARELGSIGPAAAAAVPGLIEKLNDENSEVRGYAAYALGRIGDGSDAVIEGLSRLAFDRAAVVRRAALRALQRLNPPQEKVTPLVLKILEQGDATIIAPALETLAEQGEAALPRLCQALQHDQACYWACLALAELGPKAGAAVPHLKPVLRHQDPEVRMQALAALGEIGPAAQPLIPDVIAALQGRSRGSPLRRRFRLGPHRRDPGSDGRVAASPESRTTPFCGWSALGRSPAITPAIERQSDGPWN